MRNSSNRFYHWHESFELLKHFRKMSRSAFLIFEWLTNLIRVQLCSMKNAHLIFIYKFDKLTPQVRIIILHQDVHDPGLFSKNLPLNEESGRFIHQRTLCSS